MMSFTATLAAIAVGLSVACGTTNIDESQPTRPEVSGTVVALKHSDCTELASTVNELIYAGQSATTARRFCAIGPPPAWPPKPRPASAVRICIALPESNSILINAEREDVPRILELLARLDCVPSMQEPPRERR